MANNIAKKVCPECGHLFQGNGWDGIDAHWKARHEKVMPYAEAWPLIRSGDYGRSIPLAAAIEAQEANMAGEDAKIVKDERNAVSTAADRAAKVATDTGRYEALARERGADLNEEAFDAALIKVARHRVRPNGEG